MHFQAIKWFSLVLRQIQTPHAFEVCKMQNLQCHPINSKRVPRSQRQCIGQTNGIL